MPSGVIKFSHFSLDCDRYELLSSGTAVKLEKIPMELLILLATNRGKLVTRQEIIARLWGENVFLDTEHGINTAVRKVRQALKDNSDQPRFVQTVTGKGYRFVAEILPPEFNSAIPQVESQRANTRSERRIPIAITFCVLLGSLLTVAFRAGEVRKHLFAESKPSRIRSIAVLPLANLSGDSSWDYFADGETDELITTLAENSSLRVVSRTSAMRYKGVNRRVRDIARELGVDAIVEGSLSRSSGRVHMNVQLIDAVNDNHLWADSYERDPSQAMSLPAEISAKIAREVNAPQTAAPTQKNIDPNAHDAYLHGRYVWFSSDALSSRPYFEKAIELQPDYAAAWSGLADSYVAAVAEGMVAPQPAMQKGGEAAKKAVALDDLSAEAHNSLAAYYFFSWDWKDAEKEAERATKTNPNFAEAHHLYSYVLASQQHLDDALREEQKAMELDPFSRPWALAYVYLQMRRYDDALAELRIRDQPGNKNVGVSMFLSQAYWLKGQYADSERTLEEGLRLMGRQDAAKAAHLAFAKDGEPAVERWGVQDAETRARKEYVSPFDIATAYAFSGDKNGTLRYLEQAYREHSALLALMQNEPVLDFVHSDPRYLAIVAKMGLPAAK